MKPTVSYQTTGNNVILTIPTEDVVKTSSAVRKQKAKIERIFRDHSAPPVKQVIHQSISKRTVRGGTPESLINKVGYQLQDIGLNNEAIESFTSFLKRTKMSASSIQDIITQVEALDQVGNQQQSQTYTEGWHESFLTH